MAINRRPWFWNFGNLSIVNAGTVSSERMRGLFENTYNIITIEKGKIKVDLKIVGGEKIYLKDLVQNYKCFGEELINSFSLQFQSYNNSLNFSNIYAGVA
jgi:hypothetical protein